MLVLWRICRSARAGTAFDGEGARRFPGRWNHKEVAVAYGASSLSLATLEVFVHVDPADVPDDLVYVRAELPDDVSVARLEPAKLPKGWRKFPGPVELKDLGTEWVRAGKTAVLRVPSAISPVEDNLLFNPAHPDAKKLKAGPAEPFQFDPRLWK